MTRIKLVKILYFYLLAIIFLFAITGCSRGASDLNDYIKALKASIFKLPIKNNIANIPEPKSVAYHKDGSRSPFQGDTLNTQLNLQSPLNEYPLNALNFVGTIQQNKTTWAVLLTPTMKVYKAKIGDTIGDHYAKITKIYHDHIEVIDTVKEGLSKTSNRLISIPLKEKN